MCTSYSFSLFWRLALGLATLMASCALLSVMAFRFLEETWANVSTVRFVAQQQHFQPLDSWTTNFRKLLCGMCLVFSCNQRWTPGVGLPIFSAPCCPHLWFLPAWLHFAISVLLVSDEVLGPLFDDHDAMKETATSSRAAWRKKTRVSLEDLHFFLRLLNNLTNKMRDSINAKFVQWYIFNVFMGLAYSNYTQ